MPLCCLLVVISTSPAIFGTERFAELTRKACTSCHAGAEGGTLTSEGRAFKNSRDLLAQQASQAKDGDGAAADQAAPTGMSLSGSASVLAGRYLEPFADGSRRTGRGYADLRLRIDRVLGRDDLSFNTEVIGRLDDADREVRNADQVRLITAYFRLKDPFEAREVKLGRQFVATGPRPFFLDGVNYYDELNDVVDYELFGGVPADNGEGGAQGDFAIGGRLGLTPWEQLNLGVSSTYAHDAGEPTFLQLGLDATLAATDALELSGHTYYDYIGEHLYDTLVRARYELAEDWSLRIDYAHVIPSLFLPKTSIFWVFANGAIDEGTIDLSYAPDYHWRYHVLLRGDHFEDGGQTVGGGGGFDYMYGNHRENVVGVDVLYLDEIRADGDAAVRVSSDLIDVRAYCRNDWTSELFTAFDLVTDLFATGFDRNSYSVGALVGYRFTASTVGVAGVDYLDSVQYDDRVDLHVKVTYAF